MTTTVKGAGRSRAAARTKKIDRNEQRLAELKREQAKAEEVISTAKARRKAPAPSSAAHPKVQAFRETAEAAGWIVEFSEQEDGQHLVCTRGDEWLHIFWLNGVYQKWATYRHGNSGKEQRVQNAKTGLRFIEQEPKAAEAIAKKRAVTANRTAPKSNKSNNPSVLDGPGLSLADKIAIALADRGEMPFDDEALTDEQLVDLFNNRRISWISRMTGIVHTSRVAKDSKHTKIEYGKHGRYISFASADGPFQAVSFDMITNFS